MERGSARGSARNSQQDVPAPDAEASGNNNQRNKIIAAVVLVAVVIFVGGCIVCGSRGGAAAADSAPAASTDASSAPDSKDSAPEKSSLDKAADDSQLAEEGAGDHIALAETMRSMAQYWQGRQKGYSYGAKDRYPIKQGVYNKYRKEAARMKKALEGNVSGYVVGDMMVGKRKFHKYDIYQFGVDDIGEVMEMDMARGQARVQVFEDNGYSTFLNTWKGGGQAQDPKRQLWMSASEINESFDPVQGTEQTPMQKLQDRIAMTEQNRLGRKDGSKASIAKNMNVMGWRFDVASNQWLWHEGTKPVDMANAKFEGPTAAAVGENGEDEAMEKDGPSVTKTRGHTAEWAGFTWYVTKKTAKEVGKEEAGQYVDVDPAQISALAGGNVAAGNEILPPVSMDAITDWLVNHSSETVRCSRNAMERYLRRSQMSATYKTALFNAIGKNLGFMTSDWEQEALQSNYWREHVAYMMNGKAYKDGQWLDSAAGKADYLKTWGEDNDNKWYQDAKGEWKKVSGQDWQGNNWKDWERFPHGVERRGADFVRNGDGVLVRMPRSTFQGVPVGYNGAGGDYNQMNEVLMNQDGMKTSRQWGP